MNLCRFALSLAQFFDIKIWLLGCRNNHRLTPRELFGGLLYLTDQIGRNNYRPVLIRMNDVASVTRIPATSTGLA